MLLAPTALLAIRPQAPVAGPATIYRGAPAFQAGMSPGYQDVEDTSLDSDAPNATQGGDYTLGAGPGRTLLIRFGSLRRELGPGVKVVDATLVLSPVDGRPVLRSVGRVLRSWGEGPALAPGVIAAPGAANGPKRAPSFGGATWRTRLVGAPNADWQQPGALGEADSTAIPEAQGSETDAGYVIAGLGPAVNDMLHDPGRNHGFALSFAEPVEFTSSEAGSRQPRLRLTLAPEGAPGAVADLEVVSIVPKGAGFAATIKNAGGAPESGFSTRWTIDQAEGSTTRDDKALAPGESREYLVDASPKTESRDHRAGELSFRIVPAAGDANLADKTLAWYPAGMPITVFATPETARRFETVESPRGVGLENWVESQIDELNDAYLARSRFSFALDGCLERVRLAALAVGSAPPAASADHPVETLSEADAAWEDRRFAADALEQLGAPDLGKTEFPLGSANVKVAGWSVGGSSAYPDVTGGGDTRFDGGLPPGLQLPEDPSLPAPALPAPATGLLSGNAVGVLDLLVGETGPGRLAARTIAMNRYPKGVLLNVSDASGVRLRSAQLDFFQARGGIVGAAPTFSLTGSDTGVVRLDNRPTPGGGANPFGSNDSEADGAFLVRATYRGESAWAWVKAWQLQLSALRGDPLFVDLSLRFNLPAGPVDRSVDLAQGRIATDSAGDPPAKLATLVNSGTTQVALPTKAGDWIELDLNRDRTLAEVVLSGASGMWDRFDILAYETGEKPDQAMTWAHESNWRWTAANRCTLNPDGTVDVAYHGPLFQARFLRIVARADGPASLVGIKVYAAAAAR